MSQAGVISLSTGGGGIIVNTITGNSGTPVSGNISLVTANSTPKFVSGGSTITLDFGLSNLALGSSLPSLTTGIRNVTLGLGNLDSDTGGSNNTAIGTGSLISLTLGSNNTVLGNQTLAGITIGINNLALGHLAGNAYTGAESSNILLLNAGVVGESNVIRIGTSGSSGGQQNKCFIVGIDGVNVGSVARVVTEASNQLGTAIITAGSGVTITPTANAITISASGSVPISFLTDSGTAVPAGGVLTVHGGANINTSGAGSTVTINVNNQLLMPNGSNAAPSYSFTNATNAGLYYDGGTKMVLNATNGQIFNADASTISINSANMNIQGINISSFLAVNRTNPGAYPYTVTTNDYFISVDSSGGAHTINFPNAPRTNVTYVVKDRTGNAGANNITLTTPAATILFDGSATYVMDSNFASVQLIYNGTSFEVY
jgi:hypothetical protein